MKRKALSFILLLLSVTSYSQITSSFDTDDDGVLYDEASFWNLGEGWVPIGSDSDPFAAVFEGNGHAISNLYINRPYESDIGLFGVIKNTATIQNLHLGGSLTAISGGDNVGALLGRISLGDEYTVIIDNCSYSGSVTGSQYVGGLIGNIYTFYDGYADIYDSYTDADVVGENHVGGLIGYSFAELYGYIFVYNSYAQGEAEGDDKVGGLIGTLKYDKGNIMISASSSDASATGDNGIGGLLGATDGSGYDGILNVQKSHANGDVVASSGNSGGLIGDVQADIDAVATVRKSYATGDVSGVYNVGGLAGYMYADSWISLAVSDSYASGDVAGISSVGGLVGMAVAKEEAATISINKTYAVGAVSGYANTGGLIGLAVDNYDPEDPYSGRVNVSRSYWDTVTTGQSTSSGDGTGLTTTEMQCPQSPGDSSCATSVYSGWSTSTWDFGSASEYPTLQ